MLPVGDLARGKHGARMMGTRPVFAPSETRLTVTAVIVLYRMEFTQSPAFQSVMKAREKAGVGLGSADVRVLLWDNSPKPAAERDLPEYVHYFPDESNTGLATAYNRAIDWASLNGSEWLLTLDQDTAIPDD